MRRSRGQKLATGIYRDAYGHSARVTVHGLEKEQRFPPEAELAAMQRWQAHTKAELLDRIADGSIPGTQPDKGTFAHDVQRYLKKRQGREGYKADRSHLQAWVLKFGPRPRSKITRQEVETALGAWITAGKAPKTIRHRVRVLKELWRALDGIRAGTPADGVKLPRVVRPAPTPVSQELIQDVAASLKAGKRHEEGYGSDSIKTHARFLVYALCGQRPAQIMRAQKDDVDLARSIWFVRPAKGGLPVPLPLSAGMARAWKTFIKANAWGTFNTRSFSKTLRRHGWPATIRPYQLRHTFAIDHLLAGTSLGDLQGLLGHKQITTTRDHYAPVLVALLQKAVKRRRLKL